MLLTIAIGVYLVWTQRGYKKLIKSAEEPLRNFGDLIRVEVDNEGGVHMSEKLLLMCEGIGRTMFDSLQKSTLGQLSGQARIDKGMLAAIANDVLDEKAPWIDLASPLLGDAFNVRKYISKNPKAALALVKQIAPVIGQIRGGSNVRRNNGGVPSM